MENSYLLISGTPGSGKTTLALQLAELIQFALITKDTIKEALYDALGPGIGSSALSDAAIEVLWALAAKVPQAILEANFHRADSCERVQSLPGRTLEIHCVCPLYLCMERYAKRAASPQHHAVHPKELSPQSFAKYAAPIGACPVLEVDTSSPVNARELVDRIRRLWPEI